MKLLLPNSWQNCPDKNYVAIPDSKGTTGADPPPAPVRPGPEGHHPLSEHQWWVNNGGWSLTFGGSNVFFLKLMEGQWHMVN